MRFEGQKLKISVFGQSHAAAIGAVAEGFPAGIRIDQEALAAFLRRRAPGQGSFTTARKEKDQPEFVAGLVDGVTCGTPLCAIIRNEDTRSGDYASLKDVPRPSHADWPALMKYGEAHDIRGGGAFSARMTAPLCVMGGIALQLLAERDITIGAHVASIGEVKDDPFDPVAVTPEQAHLAGISSFPVLNATAGERMLAEIETARLQADSIGGEVEGVALGLPVGIGGPLFEGLESELASALFAIPAVKGVAFGEGFGATRMHGSENNDAYGLMEGTIRPITNHAGGIVGGMTTGMPLIARVAFKPTPSIGQPQRSVSRSQGIEQELVIHGRHDPCVVPRAVPVVEAMMALVLYDRL